MNSRSLLLAVAGLAISSPMPDAKTACFSGPNPIVDLGYAKFKGSTNTTTNITTWSGLRYAAAPSGELRWQPPVDIEKRNNYSSTVTLDATQIGPVCIQGGPPQLPNPMPGSLPQSEDCLLLNVHVPSSPTKSGLPVIVEIPGGGYVSGAAEGVPGDLLIEESRGNVIYIEIQYRLGGLGFLGGSAINASGSSNVGFLDQRSALFWVQRHVSAFGGDPTKVTIFGGSAGGGSVNAQLQIHGNKPQAPFRAAISEYPYWQTYHNATYADQQYQRLLFTAKCADLKCLRALPVDTLVSAINTTYLTAYKDGLYGHSDVYYAPNVDGKVIKELPTQAFAAGRFAHVPYMSDHDGLEGLVFTNVSVSSAVELRQDLQKLWPAATKAFFDQLDAVYSISDFNGSYFNSYPINETAPNTPLGQGIEAELPGLGKNFGTNPYFYKLQQIIGDAQLHCATWWTAKSMTNADVPVWKTLWNTGALVHGSVDWALLQPPSPLGGPAPYGDMLRAYFVGFVLNLDPNSNKTLTPVQRPYWPNYGAGAQVLDFNTTAVGVVRDADASKRCEFLYSNAQILRI